MKRLTKKCTIMVLVTIHITYDCIKYKAMALRSAKHYIKNFSTMGRSGGSIYTIGTPKTLNMAKIRREILQEVADACAALKGDANCTGFASNFDCEAMIRKMK